jgi:hypothetical protein
MIIVNLFPDQGRNHLIFVKKRLFEHRVMKPKSRHKQAATLFPDQGNIVLGRFWNRVEKYLVKP